MWNIDLGLASILLIPIILGSLAAFVLHEFCEGKEARTKHIETLAKWHDPASMQGL